MKTTQCVMKNKQESLQIRIGLHRFTIQSLKALYKAQAVGNAACAKKFIKHQENIFQQFRQNKNKRKFCPILDTQVSGSPVVVPCVRLADGAAALHTDHCHSLPSLPLPPAALPSLPGYGIFIENMLDAAA